MYEYRHVVHVVLATSKSVLDQGLSHKRPWSRWGPPLGALIAGCTSPCSPLPTQQLPAEMVLALSPCGGCFFCVFFLRFYPNVRSYIRTYKTYNTYDPTQVSEESVLHTAYGVLLALLLLLLLLLQLLYVVTTVFFLFSLRRQLVQCVLSQHSIWTWSISLY